MKALDKNNFEQEITTGITLVDFWAEWCGPCKMLTPVLEDLSTKIADVKFAKVNVDDEWELASKFGIMSIPTVMIFKDGVLVDKVVWLNPPNIYESKLEEIKNQ